MEQTPATLPGSRVAATILFARRPADADTAWVHRSLAALAARFRDARVRLFVADVDAEGGGPALPGAASFDVLVLIERQRMPWLAPSQPESARRDEALAWLAGARGYRGQGREILARSAPARPAERSPGLVFAATAVRAPSLSRDAFDAHWRDRHGPLALRHHVGMSAYEQIPIECALTARAPELDGLALLHFASAEDFRLRFHGSEAGRAAIGADTRSFLDLARCEAVLMGEYGVRG
jgi:uncharacterized protein (TIGR02118 family)